VLFSGVAGVAPESAEGVMTIAAWITMLAAWSVITFFTARFFWLLVKRGKADGSKED
jgi:hypothetical protein